MDNFNNCCLPIAYKFKKELQIKNKTLTTIALSTNYSKGHLSLVFNGKRPLSDELRAKLNAILDTNF